MPVAERPMTVIERLLHAVYQHYDGDGQPVFCLRCSGPFEEKAFRAALDAVQARHPLFRSRIVEPKRAWPKFQFESSAPPIPLEIHPSSSDSAWVQIAAEHTERRFDATQAPLCRFTALPRPHGEGFDLVASFHHSVIDGLSVLALMRELFAHLSGERTSAAECTGEMTFREMQRPSLWKRTRLIGKLLWMQLKERLLPQVLLPADADAAGTCVRTVWSKELTTALVRRCRREKTTVYGALAAAALQSVAQREKWGDVGLQLQVPFDIRKYYATVIDQDTVGCFVALVDFWHRNPLAGDFWYLSRACLREMEYEKSWMMPNCWDHLMSRVAFSPAWLKPLRKLTVGVNNLGRCEEIAAGSWRVEEFSWYGRANLLGSSVAVNAATINGRMNLTLQGSQCSQQTLEQLSDLFTARIEQAVRRGSFGGLAKAA